MAMSFIHTFFRITGSLWFFALLFLTGGSGCLKIPDFDSGELPLFSSDTLTFDTVFTTLGSTTLFVKIYNPDREGLELDRLYLSGGAQSHFRINLDGKPGLEFEKVRIGPGDSLYLFCEVTINPNDPLENSPFIILDSVIVEKGNQKSSLILEAFGQNAHYFPTKANRRQVALIDLQGGTMTWTSDKPHVVYGVVYLDNGELEIKAGARVHFFGGVASYKDANGQSVFYNDGRLIIGSNARLRVQGTPESRVLITGARLEQSYRTVPGQWSGLAIDRYSSGNEIRYADIRNGLEGLSIDSLASCTISHCVFSHHTFSGIQARAAHLEVFNSLFYDQGLSSLIVLNGGSLNAIYNTFANLGNDEPAVLLSNYLCEDPPFCTDIRKNGLVAKLTNCIITGSSSDEFWIQPLDTLAYPFDLRLDHCLLRVNELIKPSQFPEFEDRFTESCLFHNSLDILFRDLAKDDFRLDTLSIAEKKAKTIMGFEYDLLQFPRDPQTPDLGCFEYEK